MLPSGLMQPSTCRLCRHERILRESHVIPKFAVEWIKKTSATGYLRGTIDPNLRRQDASKIRLLCQDCEQLFSRDERVFAETIFRPFLQGTSLEFFYGEWLRRFAVSLAWRAAVTGIERGALGDPQPSLLRKEIDDAISAWGSYLLCRTKTPGPYTHHMLLAGYIKDATTEVPEGFQTYMMRAVDTTIGSATKRLLVYTKLPAIVFVSHVIPSEPSGWRRTRIARKGHIGLGQVLSSGPFVRFVLDRASEVWNRTAPSARQHALMERDLFRDPDRALGSESYRALLAEKRARALWGRRETR